MCEDFDWEWVHGLGLGEPAEPICMALYSLIRIDHNGPCINYTWRIARHIY